MSVPKDPQVSIVEVGARDGLQNEQQPVALATKLALIDDLAAAGLRRIDAAVAGPGCCPFAPGATGNVATEDVVCILDGMGFETGLDLERLIEAGNAISAALTRENSSRVARAFTRRQRH